MEGVGVAGGKSIFFHYFEDENLNFYNPELEIWKFNYYENKVNLNNKDNSKNNDNEIKGII